jgi:hypothetical protein
VRRSASALPCPRRAHDPGSTQGRARELEA